MDVIVIFIGIGNIGDQEGHFGTVFVLIMAILYFLIALYFIGWIYMIRMHLPPYAESQVTLGAIGLFKKLTLALDGKLQ